jgi:hypothetical protein
VVKYETVSSVYAAIFEQPEGEIVRADVNVSILVFNADQTGIVLHLTHLGISHHNFKFSSISSAPQMISRPTESSATRNPVSWLPGKVVVVIRKSQLFHLTGPLIVTGSMHEIRRFPGSGFPCSTRWMRIRSVLMEGVSDHISAQAPFHRERKVRDDLIISSKY